jgi:hypothetical protein
MLNHIYIGGKRAYDMALRLKYEGFDMSMVSVEQDNEKLINKALSHNVPVYITPTYTAMFELRNMLVKNYGLKEFYE